MLTDIWLFFLATGATMVLTSTTEGDGWKSTTALISTGLILVWIGYLIAPSYEIAMTLKEREWILAPYIFLSLFVYKRLVLGVKRAF